MKNKKPLFIALISLDVIITIGLFVISIIMLANATKTTAEREDMTGFIGWLVNLKPWVYGVAFVVPLFVLLALECSDINKDNISLNNSKFIKLFCVFFSK